MKHPWMVFLPILFCGMLLVPHTTSAKPEYSRMTDKDCAFCHVPKTGKLTEAGTYYRQHRTLKGYQPPKQN